MQRKELYERKRSRGTTCATRKVPQKGLTWQECQEENKKNGFAENADWLAVGRTYGIHPWIRWGDNYICRESGYVGQGESERRKGSQTKGWQPYC